MEPDRDWSRGSHPMALLQAKRAGVHQILRVYERRIGDSKYLLVASRG